MPRDSWWSARLPAAFAVPTALSVAYYLVYSPTQSHPSGWTTTAIDAGNTVVIGLAVGIVALAVLGAGLAVLDAPLYTGGIAGILFVVGGVGIAIGPQIWLVGSLLLVSAGLVRASDDENDDRYPLSVLASVILAVIGAILALTVLTTSEFPRTTLVTATLIFVGTGLAIAHVGLSDHQRETALLLVGVLLGGVVLTGAAIAAETNAFADPAGPAYLGGVEVINGDDEAHDFDVEVLRDGELVFADTYTLQGSPSGGTNSMPIDRTWAREPATFVVRVRVDGGEWDELAVPETGADCYGVGRYVDASGGHEWLVQRDHERLC